VIKITEKQMIIQGYFLHKNRRHSISSYEKDTCNSHLKHRMIIAYKLFDVIFKYFYSKSNGAITTS